MRDGDAGIEAYLMRRQSTMEFAAGMYVFPGGKVHDSDRLVDAWVGPSPEEWGKRFGCDADTARGLVVAAVRETFEESGILLAGPDADTVVDDTSAPDMQAARIALDKQEYGFAEFLAEHDLVLRADLVGAWSHWITPPFEPRRYDTRFFVAALPEGQVVGELSRESDRADWMPWRACSRPSRPGRRRCCRRPFTPAGSSPGSRPPTSSRRGRAGDHPDRAAHRRSRRRAVPRQLPGGMVSDIVHTVTERASTSAPTTPAS